MEPVRTPFQGVTNIIRFNWHFYLLSALFLASLLFIDIYFLQQYAVAVNGLIFLAITVMATSLAVSWYVYDLSNIYTFKWLDDLNNKPAKVVNINAGFDEISHLLKARHPTGELVVLDFYDEKKHTEISIKRARKAYLPFSGTIPVSTSVIPLADNDADEIYVVFAAHEIRDNEERISFFKELCRVIKPSGNIIVTEHLRDLPNFLAYNIGFLHFVPKKTWHNTFKHAGLNISKVLKITPFVTTFILTKNGTTS
jgi:ubiquinone/menaquinone biosynthesis C-methylase UbiE